MCSVCSVRPTSAGLCCRAPSRAGTPLTSSGTRRSGSSTACLDWLRWVRRHGSSTVYQSKHFFLNFKLRTFGCVTPAELAAFCTSVLLFLWLVVVHVQHRSLDFSLLLRALLLSCYGKVLVIPAVIWEHDYSPLCLSLIKLFVLTSNSQAIRGRGAVCRKHSPVYHIHTATVNRRCDEDEDWPHGADRTCFFSLVSVQ